MRWAASSSLDSDPVAAAQQAASAVQSRLGAAPDLAIAFLTSALATPAGAVAETLQQALAPGCLIGASASAVIATDREIENGSALTLIVAQLPGVEIKPFILEPSSWGDAIDDPLEFARHTRGVGDAELVMLLGDPFSLDLERTLAAFNHQAPGIRVVGAWPAPARAPTPTC